LQPRLPQRLWHAAAPLPAPAAAAAAVPALTVAPAPVPTAAAAVAPGPAQAEENLDEVGLDKKDLEEPHENRNPPAKRMCPSPPAGEI
jgi:hypothetical protein